MKITHTDKTTDRRYTVRLEASGRAKPQYVARFSGEWIGADSAEWKAWLKCAEHKLDRLPRVAASFSPVR